MVATRVNRHPDPQLAPVLRADGRVTARGRWWLGILAGLLAVNLLLCGLLADRLIPLADPLIVAVARWLWPPPVRVVYIQQTAPRAVPVAVATVVYLVPTPAPWPR